MIYCMLRARGGEGMLQVSIFVRIVLVTEWALAFSQATPTRHVNRTMDPP